MSINTDRHRPHDRQSQDDRIRGDDDPTRGQLY